MVFSIDDYDNHEAIVFHQDRKSGLKAIIGIHNTNLGPALGGCRMWPYSTEEEAVTDVIRLSRGMTYKAAITGLPLGGGKAVIIGDPRKDKTPELFREMGRFIDQQKGRYITAEDVGTTVEDMDIMREQTAYARGTSTGMGNPSPLTALGVFHGIRAAVKHRFSQDDVKDIKVAVQGLGNVGATLAEHLARDGAQLVVADIDPARTEIFKDKFGAEIASTNGIMEADVDVLAPCALGASINDQTVPNIRASIIAGAANNQLAEPKHGLELWQRDILYAPDYAINAGGVVAVAAEGPEVAEEDVMAMVDGIYDTMSEIFARSKRDDTAPEIIADKIAEERFRQDIPIAA
jgi:leucine dehydrogenase